MTPEEILKLFPEPEFEEAVGVLQMIKQTPEQMDEYISHLKFRLDESARIDYAREEGEKVGRIEGQKLGLIEGEKKGRSEGELLGRIITLQEILSISEPTREELSAFSHPQLVTLAEQLQNQLRQRSQ